MRIAAAVLLLLCSCARTPERIADQFVDRYFVEFDQTHARELTCGLATEKIDEEIRLVEGVRRAGTTATSRPQVYYSRRSLRTDGARGRGNYEITIRFGGDETKKQALLTLEQRDGHWCIANFLVQ